MKYINIFLHSAICPQCKMRIPVISSFDAYAFVSHSVFTDVNFADKISPKLCEPKDGIEKRYQKEELVEFEPSTFENDNPYFTDVLNSEYNYETGEIK